MPSISMERNMFVAEKFLSKNQMSKENIPIVSTLMKELVGIHLRLVSF
jgi:hypothetical protein